MARCRATLSVVANTSPAPWIKLYMICLRGMPAPRGVKPSAVARVAAQNGSITRGFGTDADILLDLEPVRQPRRDRL